MVSRNNAVFRFLLDIKDFVVKGRKVIQINNQITGSTTKASGSMDRLATSTRTTGQSMAANAVNFQTATQGMLNLSTAGVQTFTSFSNLDRAGNRLAMSQIGVSRATDLLNNKQLRLNELQAKGLGGSQKAVLLTNELKTARADLLVKTDKLKIEEGALFDIQLLFVTNIANVMISSLQTIVSLKNAHVGATIKQIVQERLLSTTIFTKSVPSWVALSGAAGGYDIIAKKVINTNRLLMIGIPVVGAAVIGVSVAVQAYTENWGGFRDMVVSILPFMKDQEKLLGDVNNVLGETNTSAAKLNGTFEDQLDLVFRLPDNYELSRKGLEKLSKAYETVTTKATDATIKTKEFNAEILKTPPSFRVATQEGGIFPQSFGEIGSSNIIKTEGDGVFTADTIQSTTFSQFKTTDLIRMASAGVLAQYNPKIIGKSPPQPIITNVGGNLFRRDSLYDNLNPFDSTTKAAETGKMLHEQAIYNIKSDLNRIGDFARQFNINAELEGSHLRLPESIPELFAALGGGISRDLALHRGDIIGITPESERQTLEMRKAIKMQIQGGLRPSTLGQLIEPISGEGKFIGGGGFFPGLEEIFPGVASTGTNYIKGLKTSLRDDKQKLEALKSLKAKEGNVIDPFGIDEAELNFKISSVQQLIDKSETDPNILIGLLTQDKLLKQTVSSIVSTPEEQIKFFEKLEKEKQAMKIKELMKQVQDNVKRVALQKEMAGAKKAGVSLDIFRKQAKIGAILRDIKTRPHLFVNGETFKDVSGVRDLTDKQKEQLESLGIGTLRVGEDLKFESEKVQEARMLLDIAVAGLYTDNTLSGGFRTTDPIFGFAGIGGRQIAQSQLDGTGTFGIGKHRLGLEEGSMIETLRQLQIETLGPGAFTKTRSTDFRRMVQGVDATASPMEQRRQAMSIMNQGVNVSDMSRFRGQISPDETLEMIRRNAKTLADNKARLIIRDRNANLLRFGGRLREGMTIEEEGAVVGGYSSPREFSAASRAAKYQGYQVGQLYAASFGILANSSIMRGRSSRNSELGRVTSASVSIKNALASAGLGFKNVGYLNSGYRATAAQAARAIAEHSAVVSYNNNQYAKATQINILEGGFDLRGFRGTSMDLPSLQDKVLQQDDLMKSIGLTRTEAFQIIDTQGRGREEIDDRLKWKSRLNSISTGTAVL